MVEPSTVNREVAGSNPAPGAKLTSSSRLVRIEIDISLLVSLYERRSN